MFSSPFDELQIIYPLLKSCFRAPPLAILPILLILSAMLLLTMLSAIFLFSIPKSHVAILSTGVNSSFDDPPPKSRFRAPPLAIRPILSGSELLAILPSTVLSAILQFAILIPHGRFYAKRSNQGESSGSGGRAGEERNGGGGDGNQGIGGGVGGGGHREGIGNERRSSRGRSHGGGNGDDEDSRRRGWVGYIVDEGRPVDPRPDRMAEILLPFNFQIFATVESLEITGLSVRVRIVRVVSLGFTSVALVCLSASIRERGTNPRLATVLSWIGTVATFLGFISMIAMALLASFIP